jgi:hypothetical protein
VNDVCAKIWMLRWFSRWTREKGLLFFPFNGAGEGPFLYKSCYDDANDDEDEDSRNGPGNKGHEASIRTDHCLPKGHFHKSSLCFKM